MDEVCSIINNYPYISKSTTHKLKNKYKYLLTNKNNKIIDNLIKEHNRDFILHEIDLYNDLLNNVCGYKLDNEQKEFVVNNDDNILLIASAGSGKTLSLIGKIRYLIESSLANPNDILCISYTNEAVNNLKGKLLKYYNYDIDVKTFHKLATGFLKDKIHGIISSNYLDYIVDEYFKSTIYMNNRLVNITLKYLGIPNYKKDYLKGDTNDIVNLKKLLVRFIHLFKSNNYDLYNFSYIFEYNNLTIFNRRKNKLFLYIVFDIYQIYTQELDSCMMYDFNDLINLATNNIPDDCSYKYIIIDEYQDTSIVRLNLIKAIIKKTNARLIVVGDDYQSIYRFAGCDLNIFLNFDKYFDDPKIMYINSTYRNSKELVYIANDFIMKNKFQMRKNIKSNKRNNKPIKIMYYDKYNNHLLNLINKIKEMGNILILGRNYKDIFKFLDDDILIDKDGYINIESNNLIRYLTVHKSKGLESDNVIIVNLEDSLLGFPNKIEDEDILKYVILNKERYCYDEERRLFYVALTRTKNNVYLLLNKSKSSTFVDEVVKNYSKYIEYI